MKLQDIARSQFLTDDIGVALREMRRDFLMHIAAMAPYWDNQHATPEMPPGRAPFVLAEATGLSAAGIQAGFDSSSETEYSTALIKMADQFLTSWYLVGDTPDWMKL